MIKVVIERRTKEGLLNIEKPKVGDIARGNGASLFALLHEGRAAAMKHPGYITGETLVDTDDSSHILVVSSWQSLKDWEDFKASEVRVSIDKRMEPLLAEPPKFRTYRYLSYEQAIKEAKG